MRAWPCGTERVVKTGEDLFVWSLRGQRLWALSCQVGRAFMVCSCFRVGQWGFPRNICVRIRYCSIDATWIKRGATVIMLAAPEQTEFRVVRCSNVTWFFFSNKSFCWKLIDGLCLGLISRSIHMTHQHIRALLIFYICYSLNFIKLSVSNVRFAYDSRNTNSICWLAPRDDVSVEHI